MSQARARAAVQFASSEVPLYYQLSTILREKILSGAYAAGDRLPTEAELVADYGISRITVRQALKSLEEERLIRREAGRGTFVTGHSRVPQTFQMDGSLDDLISMGRDTSVRLLDLRKVAANRDDAAAFDVEPGAPMRQCVRMRFHHNEPFSHIVSRLPEAIAARFEPEDWQKGSIMQALEERLGLVLQVADQTIRATLADAAISRLLKTRIGAPLLSVDRLVRSDEGRVLARVHTSYRSDVYSLTVHLTRGETSGRGGE